MYLSMYLYNQLNTFLLVSTLKGLNAALVCVSHQHDVMQSSLGEMRNDSKPLK